MKTILLKLRKCLCLTLSIFLLASNMQVFAQVAVDKAGLHELYFLLDEMSLLNRVFKGMECDIASLESFISNPTREIEEVMRVFYEKQEYVDHVNFNVNDIKTSYEVYRENYNLYSTIANTILEEGKREALALRYTQDLSPFLTPEDTKEISKMFPDKFLNKRTLFLSEKKDKELYNFIKKQKYYRVVDDVSSPNVVWVNDKDIEKIRSGIKYMRDKIAEMKKGIKVATTAQQKLLRQSCTPPSVLEYAYKNGMLPKEKAGVKLTLEAMDADVSVNSLVKSIRQYLTDFGTKIKDPGLMKKLEGMTLAERTKYVDELTELQSGSKKFIEDLNKLDKPTKRYIGKNIIHGTWATVGIMVGLTLLFELIPQNSNANNINKSLEIMDALDDIAYKIENGEATMPEMLYFYTIPENEYLILNDPLHTLNFVKLAQGVMEAEEILLEAEKENKAKENKAIENSILKNYQKQASKTDFGVGTL